MAYPDSIYVQRELENLPGLEFDPSNKKTLFAEDILRLGREIEQIEDTLGLNLSNIEDLIDYIVDGKLESKWPIGTAYINFSDSTNPAELLGFGTWELDSEGRVLVGKAPTGTFSTVGTIHGTERETLDISQMPEHKHESPNGNGFLTDLGAGRALNTASGASYGFRDAGRLTRASGGGQSHNNIQPTLVVYIWRRTA